MNIDLKKPMTDKIYLQIREETENQLMQDKDYTELLSIFDDLEQRIDGELEVLTAIDEASLKRLNRLFRQFTESALAIGERRGKMQMKVVEELSKI